MSVLAKISEIEDKWHALLGAECKRIFENHHIPSHNASHHERVWANAKLLIRAMGNTRHGFSSLSIESLITACFFHDTGLTVTIDEKHGKASSDLCNNFLKAIPDLIPESIDEILSAIEFHENKEYLKENANPFSLLSILSAADDADAFGYIGIYRYAEIYLMRQISIQHLASIVLANLDSRFNNIKKQYQNFTEFYMQMEQNYLIARNFYTDLQRGYLTNSANYTQSIIQIIQTEIIEKHKLPIYVWLEQLNKPNSLETIDFIYKIIQEHNGV